MNKRWTSDESREIAKRLRWPTSLLPDIPQEIERVYGFNPPYSAILKDINCGSLVRDTNEAGMPVMRRVRMEEQPRYALEQTVWYVADDHVVHKLKVRDIRQFSTKYVCKPPAVMKDREIINSYRLETDRCTAYDRGHYVWEDSLYEDELHARVQADDELNVEIVDLEAKLQTLRKRRDQNARRLKKLEKQAADKQGA